MLIYFVIIRFTEFVNITYLACIFTQTAQKIVKIYFYRQILQNEYVLSLHWKDVKMNLQAGILYFFCLAKSYRKISLDNVFDENIDNLAIFWWPWRVNTISRKSNFRSSRLILKKITRMFCKLVRNDPRIITKWDYKRSNHWENKRSQRFWNNLSLEFDSNCEATRLRHFESFPKSFGSLDFCVLSLWLFDNSYVILVLGFFRCVTLWLF